MGSTLTSIPLGLAAATASRCPSCPMSPRCREYPLAAAAATCAAAARGSMRVSCTRHTSASALSRPFQAAVQRV
eukprot:913263-Lingulodinium_polyedra.AAC.1